ncbi:MAG TPA: PEGA domain-containing protein [Gemmataceae bacterium]
MRRLIMRFVLVVTLGAMCSFAVCPMLRAQAAPAAGPQQFVVLQSEALTVPFEALTSEQAHCAISGSGSFATMRCQTPAATAKASYHYVAILVVDQQGMAYGVACHQSLVDFWCKKMPAGVAIQGTFDAARKSLLIADGQKSHSYQILTSALVGPVQPRERVLPGKQTRNASSQTAPAAAQPSQTAPAAVDAAQNASNATSSKKPEAATPAPASAAGSVSNAPSACMPTAAASCSAFVSEPAGADIYVDGKFVGNTPSTLTLAPGSHEIRIQAGKFKPWTRTLESTAGSTVTIHAALAKK